MSDKWTLKYWKSPHNDYQLLEDGDKTWSWLSSMRADNPASLARLGRLISDANYGASIRAFAEAAEEKIQALVKPPMNFFASMDRHQDLVDTLALLPAPDPPNPTRAEQGEELKAFIEDKVKWYSHVASVEDCDRLKAMVDALVAGD